MRQRLKFVAQMHDFRRVIDIVGLTNLDPRTGDLCQIALPTEFVLKNIEDVDFDAPREPTFSLDYVGAQSLLDALLAAGVKPSMPADESKQVAALKYHLEDMRKLVFVERPAP